MKATLVFALMVLAACSRGADGSGQLANGDTAMADMPGMSTTEGVALTAAQIARGGVQWEPVAAGVASASATVPGQVVPNEDRTARLGAPVGGRVLAVPVRPGDRVRAGHVLVTLQSPDAGVVQSDVAKAEAEVASQRAQTTYARAARERAERLLAIQAIPQQDYERAVADDALAVAGLARAESELRRARTTAQQIGADDAPSGQIALRAPFSGVVLVRTAVPGAVVDAGAPLVVVTDPRSLWLTIDAPERLAGLFRAGARLRFTVPAYPADTFSAQIDAVGAGLDPSTRTLPIRAVLRNPDGRLKPEMLAGVMVEGGPAGSGTFVPGDAVQLLDGKSVVFIAHPDGRGGARFVAREVEVGPTTGGRVIITTGLAPGDVVVNRGALAVKAQLKKDAMPDMEM